MILSKKYKDFLKNTADVEFLEGTTAAGKTTVGIFKFMLQVAKSEKLLHIISGLDLGTIEKNIVNKDLGIVDVFGDVNEGGLVCYFGNGDKSFKLPHIKYLTPGGEKIILLLGYDDKARWKKALGGQYGCLYIDEINIADMEYVRESAMRCDYLLGTLNPDDPNLDIYKEYVNRARPIDKYANDAPPELLDQLNEQPKNKWCWWYFSFEHNLGLTPEKIEKIKSNVPEGTKLFKNKILGIRGKATGLVFASFSNQKNVIDFETAKKKQFVQFSCGVDTAYSSKSDDTLSFIFTGITSKGELIILDERNYNNRDLNEPIAPSDTVKNLLEFLERNRTQWGFARNVFVDSADQATIKELEKFKRANGSIYNFVNAWKKTKIIDRIVSVNGWIAKEKYLVMETCVGHLREINSYSWLENKDNTPEDRNNHTIDACSYSWIPYADKIGGIH